jgi:hypothetical protein
VKNVIEDRDGFPISQDDKETLEKEFFTMVVRLCDSGIPSKELLKVIADALDYAEEREENQ